MQAGADIIYGVAACDSGGTASFLEAVLDDEMADGLRRMMKGFEPVDFEEEVALVKRLTPRGNFLAEKHTRRHFKDFWRPQILSRDSFETWQGKGRISVEEAARQRARRLLAEHQPPPLSAKAEAEIERILT
jgi:trimethylamine--corrinoid protein Co-methyltransferase